MNLAPLEKNLNIVIYADSLAGFPIGYAACNYVRLQALGMVQNGMSVRILIPGWANHSHGDVPVKGTYRGVQYEHLSGKLSGAFGFVERQFLKFRSNTLTVLRLLQLRSHNKVDCVMYYGRNPHFFKLVSTACKNFKIPLIAQIVEWELAVMGLQQSQYDALSRFYRHALNNSDAFIVISAYLEDRCKYADMQLGLRRPCLRVPVLFDASAWEGIKPKIRARPYLLYCAALENYTADAILLLTAFSLSRLEGYDLLLVGNAGHSTCEALKSKALSLGIDHDVTVISDYLDEEDLLSLYAGAAVLLAPLNDDDQSRARFPSKIAHYVYSGNPVITNDVGEISRYFTDKESVFLARPNDPVDLANVMFEAATSAESKAIGQRGKNVAITEFSIEKHGRRLADFFTSVVSR